MKKTLILVLALLAVLALAITAPAALAEDAPATIADVYVLEGVRIEQTALYENVFVCAGTLADGTLFRATAESAPEVFEKSFDLDFFSPDYDALFLELVGPLAVTEFEDLTPQIPPQEQLDALVGLTGEDLLNDGWTHSSWNLETLEFTMIHGLFSYDIVFDGKVENFETFDEYADMAGLTVKSVRFAGLGDACDVDPFAFGPIIDCTGSELYTEEELAEAADLILGEFANWPEGCVLHTLFYAGDEACTEENLAWLRSLNEGTKQYVEVAEFYSEFTAPEDGEAAGAFEPGALYTDWQWWLAREEGGEWELLTWGY